MTFADLLPDSTRQLGSRETMAWFFCGIASFGALERWIIPEHEDDEKNMCEESHDRSPRQKVNEPPAAATCTAASSSDPREKDGAARPEGGPRKRLAAGKPGQNGSASSNGDSDRSPDLNSVEGRRDLLRTSMITFAAMTLHNLPEGLSVYLSALANVKLGLQLAVAIMLHNIPEGMAVAIPLYVATDGSVARVLGMTLVNGLAEPVGVVVGGYLLMDFLSPPVLSRCLAGVAGIMACISLHELQPTAIKYCGKDLASFALLLGMFICWVAMEGVEEIVGRH
ncbi:MAG: Zinc/iron permease [Olpidium bornovanus]|uniref:Zinc/iron permease n=1 Tax=Olpidium bornovanus TaxID=278681 RepID=A0A8H7ZZ76_9FUNG|nr:MAG: Zinc/iron permease [Olpidium bornovanus]